MKIRRCLICANINPCREHSGADQADELERNDREIARIRSEGYAPPHQRQSDPHQ